MSRILINICTSQLNIAEQWDALTRHASSNVFMNPAALDAVYETRFAKLHTLLAWDQSMQPNNLVGVWALQERKITGLGPAFLTAPPYDYAFVTNPVINKGCTHEVMSALLDAIAAQPSLPKTIRIKYLDGECATYNSMIEALARRGAQVLTLAERARPFVSREFGVKHSGSTRKKLRQDWNRLCATGSVDIVNDRTPGAVRDAFEVFLSMEAKSWKGERGTALLAKDTDAAFVRRLIANLAAQQNASVALLRVDGQPIAAQVLLYQRDTAYTWKIAYDAAYGKYSPGSLLVDRLTEQLFATTNLQAIESCSPDGSFMGQLWEGRRPTVDLLIDLGTRKSLGFAMAVIGERGYAQLRRLRNSVRSAAGSIGM